MPELPVLLSNPETVTKEGLVNSHTWITHISCYPHKDKKYIFIFKKEVAEVTNPFHWHAEVSLQKKHYRFHLSWIQMKPPNSSCAGESSTSLFLIPLLILSLRINNPTSSLLSSMRSSARRGSVALANTQRRSVCALVWVCVYARSLLLTESAVINAPVGKRERERKRQRFGGDIRSQSSWNCCLKRHGNTLNRTISFTYVFFIFFLTPHWA